VRPKAACDLKVAMIFGKKPGPRGTGEREGERERYRRFGAAKETQERAERHAKCRVYVLEPRGKPSGNPPARAGEMVV
jgi:hypothetical protein